MVIHCSYLLELINFQSNSYRNNSFYFKLNFLNTIVHKIKNNIIIKLSARCFAELDFNFDPNN